MSGRFANLAPGFEAARPVVSVVQAEAVLADWFEAPVVLTSSGRAALLLCFQQFSLNRYRDTISLPRMISACVLDAVIRCGFPVDAASGQAATLTLLYHQYGFQQLFRPEGLVVEDICHSFFASPSSGARMWAGQAAVFSLPKFFRTSGMVGGIVVPDRQLADQLRQARDGSSVSQLVPRSSEQILAPGEIEAAYLDKLLHPRADPAALGGFPATLDGLREAGAARREFLDKMLQASAHLPVPEGWSRLLQTTLPFVFPVFGPEQPLRQLEARLRELSVNSGIYKIDSARRMDSPFFMTAALLPCHNFMPETFQDSILDCIDTFRPFW